ncbi:RsmB/NOP family class I SAM-dependent RNA methyltransferase [Planktotalea sp.]|uniref:RsmB/NOP family class I SAM-dependent RNA methyltransferase n=1 Tax=Planktotalea sp. TaxID=2029877 RepID=UPI003299D5F4
MTPGARVQAAIECLDDIFAGAPAEKTLTAWARRSRFAGSKDRAAVRDHVFDVLRNRDSCIALGGSLTGRSAMIGLCLLQGVELETILSGVGHAPSVLSDEEQALLSQTGDFSKQVENLWDMPKIWQDTLIASHQDKALAIAQALRARAPVDLRVNIRKTTLEAAQTKLAGEGITAVPCRISDTALRVVEGARAVKNSQSYLDGFVELQDAGSQALVDELPLSDGMRVLDYCAGGGGKSLAMAARVRAKYFAHDKDTGRMKDIDARAKRAGVKIECLSPSAVEKQAPFDMVLCDAPCSGSGAWRRSPDAKWRSDLERLNQLTEIQSEILLKAKGLVRSGGYLAYATCSLFAEENEDQIKNFLSKLPEFDLISQKSWTPLQNCDGFHVSVLRLMGE